MRFSRFDFPFSFFFFFFLGYCGFVFVCILHLFSLVFVMARCTVCDMVCMGEDGWMDGLVMEYGRRADIPSINQFSDNVYKISYINEITVTMMTN